MKSESSGLKPVYLIYSDQELLLQRALDRLVKRMTDAGGTEFDIDNLDGDATTADAVLTSANMLPVMSERRLVVVSHADKLSTADLGVLADYASDPNPTTTLVLVFKKIAKNLRIYKAVDALGGVAEYKPPAKKDFANFVVGMFADRGKKIGLEAAGAFVRAVGYDLRHIDTEIGKVIAYTGDRLTLSRDDIDQVISETAPVSIFDFLDSLGARDARTALSLLERLVTSGESIHGIAAMSARHLRHLISVRAVMTRSHVSGSPESVARAIGSGMQAWQAKNLIRQAERFTAAELVGAFRSLADTEREMKTSRDSRLAYERWLCQLCSNER